QGGEEDHKHKPNRWEVMARKSLGEIRRASSISHAIKEPLKANTDDNNWSLSYLRDRFGLKDLEDLFEDYRLRLRHVLFMVYLMLQLLISSIYIIILLTDTVNPEEPVSELLGHACIFLVCISLLVYAYNEDTFKRFPALHLVMSIIIVLALTTADGVVSIAVTQANDANQKIRFGNIIYNVLVVYVFLPISRTWLVFLISMILCVLDIMIFVAIDCLESEDKYFCKSFWEGEMVGVEVTVLFCVNVVGLYWRFMSEVAFRRAFLDKRGNLESRFKLEQEKKQEDVLLRSILPDNIMQNV
ncbi:unnamed protein product, partial [Meganyctiphanes norvegica]